MLKNIQFLGNIASNVITVILSIVILYYLGWTIDNTQEINIDDWKRKYIIVFAWMILIYNSILLVKWLYITFRLSISIHKDLPPDSFNKFMGNITLLMLLCIIINILMCIFIFQYMGYSFDKKDIDFTNWRRKYIIFFAWFSLVLCSLGLYMNIVFNTYLMEKELNYNQYKLNLKI